MKNFKVLVATSLACVLDVGVVYGNTNECIGSSQSILRGISSFACFKYSSESKWKGYNKSKQHGNVFGSLSDFDGQYIPKLDSTALHITLSQSTLVLADLQSQFGLKYPFQVGLYANLSDKEGNNSLKFDSFNALTVANIIITEDFQKSKDHDNKTKQESFVQLTFSGNGTTSYYDLMRNSAGEARIDDYSNVTLGIELYLALLGGVWNDSGRRVTLEFKDGARMMGDLHVEKGGNSQINVVFNGGSLWTKIASSRYTFSTVFEGGIYSNEGEINVEIEGGSVVAKSWSFGSYGIMAKNGGKNVLSFSAKNSYYGMASQSLHTTDVSAYSFGENQIIFKNRSASGNLFQARIISAFGGKNEILSEDSRVNFEVENLMIADGKNGVSENIVILNGMMTVGRIVLGNNQLKKSERFGLVALFNGKNSIDLKEQKKKKSKEYDTNRTFAVSQILAEQQGWNLVNIDGDLAILYRNEAGGMIGGSIVANNGGNNFITVNGGFYGVRYSKPNDIILERSLNVMDETIYTKNSDVLQTLILATGNLESKNQIKVMNYNQQSLSLGYIVACEKGENELVLYGASNKTSRIMINEIHASSKNAKDKFKLEGQDGVGGFNNVVIYGGSEISIKKIVSGVEGENTIQIFKNSETQLTRVSDVIYSSGGLTSFFFGDAIDHGNNVSDVRNGFILRPRSPFGIKRFAFEFFNSVDNARTGMGFYYLNLDSGSFYGDVEYGDLKKKKVVVSFFLQKDVVFAGRIYSQNLNLIGSDIFANNILYLGNGSKFILKNSGQVHFDTLILSQSTHSNTNVFLDTINLPGTVLDLATDGGDFSSFKRGNQGKTLDITTMVINANDSRENPPLLRFYAGGTGEGQVDNIKVQDFKSGNSLNGGHSVRYKIFGKENGSTEEKEIKNGGTSLQAQVFLPTDLIGHDFTNDDVAILTVENGGENLNVTAREAQTGFTTYKVDIIKLEEGSGQLSRVKRSSSSSSSHRWKLGKTLDAKISPDSTKHAGNILTHNPSAWVTVLNSLNKRMGELRDNPYNQGVWARVFGGEQTSNHSGVKIDSGYVFLQSGYDYVFSLGSPLSSSLNYLGFAVSYGFTNSKSKEFVGGGIFNVPYAYHAVSHTVEFGLYDVFLHSSGFYSDSVIKVGYITTDFQGINEHSSFAEVSNCYVTLGEELGYQFKFGAKEEWMITPQVEVIYGYLTESHAKQEFQGQMLHSILDGVHTLRTRLGADFTYRYKGKSQVYDFRIGASYEFDYANASATYGIVGATYLDKIKHKSLISTDHRAVINIGTNMMIHEQVRLYADLESSYGGKVNTKYQASVGVRYSFGEKSGLSSKEIDVKMPMQVGKEGGRNDYKY